MTGKVRRGGVMLAAALLAGLLPAALLPAAPALAAPATCGGSGTVTTLPGTLPDKATYEIQCPAGPWNGTLFQFQLQFQRARATIPGRTGHRGRTGGDHRSAGTEKANGVRSHQA